MRTSCVKHSFRRNMPRKILYATLLLATLIIVTPENRAAQKSRNGSSSSSVAAITDVKTAVESGNLVVSILSDRPVSHEQFKLSNPSRLVVDFPGAENRVAFFKLPINTMSVKQLRLRQFQAADPKITRLVFDLEENHGKYEILGDGNALRIVFHNGTNTEKAQAAPANLIASSVPIVAGAIQDAPALPIDLPKPEPQTTTSDETQRSVPPVINDLSTTEIPLSARGTGTVAEVKPRQSRPFPTMKDAPAPAVALPSPPAAAPTSPMAIINQAPQPSQFAGQPLTLDLVDIPLVDFFRLMAEEGGINVVMDPEIKGTISIKVVKVPWDQIFEAALLNSGLDKQVEGNLVRIASRRTLQAEAKAKEDLKKAEILALDTETRIQRLNYAKATSFVALLAEAKSVKGTVVVDERSNSLILTDIPASIGKMVSLVQELDRSQPQVEIEARIVSANRDFARDIGVQFGFVQGNLERVTVGGPNTFGTIGGTRPIQTPRSAYIAGDARSGRGASDSSTSQGAGISPGGAGNLNVNIPAGKVFGGLGISVGNILDTFLLDAAITAGETKGLAKLISQPKVTTQNNQVAIINQGVRFPVQIVSNNTVSIQFVDAALILTVTPQITYEGNVVLDLKVENNTPDFGRVVNTVPSIRTSESTTRVLVTDGGTTLIGGIMTDTETSNEDRIPGLASLPLIGHLFRRTSVTRTVEEVLFFVTPRIVK